MAENTWPVLKSCESQITSSGEENDGLSQLPHEVLLLILSRLSMKEAARTSMLSHKWKELWAYYPGIFNFEDSRTNEERLSRSDQALVSQDTSDFVNWVTQVVEQHHGPTVEEFKVAFDLDNTYQFDIDKWVVFALAKGAKRLELDFNARLIKSISHQYTLPLECCIPLESPYNLACTKSGLKTLVLNQINIATEVLDCFLYSCPFLENLCICFSPDLTSIRVSGSPLSLKHLDVSGCRNLENIDILAPKLLTLIYKGQQIQLHIRNASLLSNVSIGGLGRDSIAYAFDSISEYYSHLEYLHLTTSLLSEMNWVIPPVSILTNLKHLKLTIEARCGQTLFGWITLIEASPVLQKLTLELSSYDEVSNMRLGEHRSPRPFTCLKTLGLYGFVGNHIDLEFAMYVLENAIVLEELVIDFKDWLFGLIVSNCLEFSKACAMKLKEMLPPGARLIINE